MTLAILSALRDEQRGLLQELVNPVKCRRGGRTFWRGQWHQQEVVLALSKVGKVAAATTATTLIEAFGVTAIVFTGVAGGIGEGVRVADVVVANAFAQHDMDSSPLFPRFEVPLYGCNQFTCDADLSARLLQACRAVLAGSVAAVHTGLIVSGDRFVASAAEARQLRASLQQADLTALAVEMEGAAVAQVCHDYAVPFAAMRSISDRADDQAHVDFAAFVAQVASPYALAILRHFMQSRPENQHADRAPAAAATSTSRAF